jgi:Zn-dependent protease
MTGSISIGRVRNTTISIHWTFAILIVWISIISTSVIDFWWNLAFILTIFLCVVLHELGHAVAASYFGITTREISLLPIGGVALLDRLPQRPRAELIIALAGPLVNLIIALILLFPAVNSMNHGLVKAIESINGHNFIVNLFMVNITMAAFNLIPAFPMDGGRVLRAILSMKLDRIQATKIAARTGQLLAVAAVMVSIFTNQHLISNPGLLLISLFVFYSAQAELQSFVHWSMLDGHVAREVTMKDFGEVESTDKLSTVVNLMLSSSYHSFVVFRDQKAVGTLTRADLIQSLSQKGPEATAGEVMNSTIRTIQDDISLEKTYNTIMESPERPLIVTHNTELLGIVDTDNILEFIMAKQALTTYK